MDDEVLRRQNPRKLRYDALDMRPTTERSSSETSDSGSWLSRAASSMLELWRENTLLELMLVWWLAYGGGGLGFGRIVVLTTLVTGALLTYMGLNERLLIWSLMSDSSPRDRWIVLAIGIGLFSSTVFHLRRRGWPASWLGSKEPPF